MVALETDARLSIQPSCRRRTPRTALYQLRYLLLKHAGMAVEMKCNVSLLTKYEFIPRIIQSCCKFAGAIVESSINEELAGNVFVPTRATDLL